jgi:hypothetical protein
MMMNKRYNRIWGWFWLLSLTFGINRVVGFCRFLENLGKVRPLGWIVSSRGVVSSLVENIHMEVISYDNVLYQTNEFISEISVSSPDNHVYISMIGLFVYYLWLYLDMNNLVLDKRFEDFSGFGISRKITNQVCLVFIFVFTKDVLYVF